MVQVGDPVGLGLAQSLSRPGGNVTGLASYGPETAAKSLELLKEAVPHLKRVAVLWTAANPLHAQVLRDSAEPARLLDVRLQPLKVASADDIEAAFRDTVAAQAQVVWPLGDSLFNQHAGRIATLALNARLATMYLARNFPEAGVLMSFGPNGLHQMRRAAGYVDKILKGARAGELPIEQPTRFELVINMNRKGHRADDPARAAAAGRSRHRVSRSRWARALGERPLFGGSTRTAGFWQGHRERQEPESTYFVEKLGLSDVIEERGLMEPSQFECTRWSVSAARTLVHEPLRTSQRDAQRATASKRLRSTSFPRDGEVEFFNRIDPLRVFGRPDRWP